MDRSKIMELNEFSKIKEVEAPGFLLVKIQQKIIRNREHKMPIGIVVALHISVIAIIILNVFVYTTSKQLQNNTTHLTESMHLTSNNNLY